LYTKEQDYCLRYLAVDLSYSWECVRRNYMRWFPAIVRPATALACRYYRTNREIPILEDGLLVFGAPRGRGQKLSKRRYRGVQFICRKVRTRADAVPTLLEMFPEEYEDLANRWIRPEDRGKGREAGKSSSLEGPVGSEMGANAAMQPGRGESSGRAICATPPQRELLDSLS
jgi:hypothetical protein